jgi:hypothetical protein
MCWEVAIPLAAGVATSVAGSALTNQSEQSSAQNTANVRNAVLENTLKLNDGLSKDAEGVLSSRLAQVQPAAVASQQDLLTGSRQKAINANLPTINPTNMPGAADSSTLVKSAIAKALQEAMDQSDATAAAQAKLGGYGDLFLSQGLQNDNAARYIDTDIQDAKQNNDLLPQEQDLAANENYQPISPIGGILTGVGNSVAAAAGAGKLTNTGWYSGGGSTG